MDKLAELRHSCAHLLAAAVMDLYPKAKRTIGPPIDNGFYYDFEFPSPISTSDLTRIEEKMRELAKSWPVFVRHEVSLDDARLENKDNPYKLELIDEFSKKGEKITVYEAGGFRDLCRGGHVADPSRVLKHFKLLSVAGAYWRGDEKNKMLTRIYGTCFPTKEALDKYLWQQEEAKKRDHRKLGKELGLFLFSTSVGPGLPLFAPKGAVIRSEIEAYLKKIKEKYGLTFVWTPHIARSQLYIQSKHWQKYDAMMPALRIEDDEYTLKPMNCPHHFQIYLMSPHSYKELPIRYAENATVYRYEKSGEINGLFRVRSLTQDDSHWFVQSENLPEEIDKAIDLAQQIFKTFQLPNYRARISIRDKGNKDKYLGEDRVWDIAEKELVKAVEKRKIKYELGEGEAAFYGPKIDIMVEDSLGREWQLTTIQLDFNQPKNFDLAYTDKNGEKKQPAVLHVAILGSIERFMAILIEHFAGAFPLWLSPVQVKILPISEKHAGCAKEIALALKKNGIRHEVDEANKTVGYKIRESTLQKVPYMIIIGDKESQSASISVRSRDGKDLGVMEITAFISKLKENIETYQ
ncbi:threonine--tRNA ligase [Candidatus Roizmanbacteria bacterium]|nr:threonine--tRNA ligase [Candidatus Roizmanbacteria bacterium]